jgi:hypothetical protein
LVVGQDGSLLQGIHDPSIYPSFLDTIYSDDRHPLSAAVKERGVKVPPSLALPWIDVGRPLTGRDIAVDAFQMPRSGLYR